MLKNRFTIGFISWTIIVWILCLIPGQNLIIFTSGKEFMLDKIVHACIYFVMYILMYLSVKQEHFLSGCNQRTHLCCLLWVVGSGLVIEILQRFLIAGRYFDIFDLLANVIGTMLALCMIHFIIEN